MNEYYVSDGMGGVWLLYDNFEVFVFLSLINIQKMYVYKSLIYLKKFAFSAWYAKNVMQLYFICIHISYTCV